jgi:hypothetical protein
MPTRMPMTYYSTKSESSSWTEWNSERTSGWLCQLTTLRDSTPIMCMGRKVYLASRSSCSPPRKAPKAISNSCNSCTIVVRYWKSSTRKLPNPSPNNRYNRWDISPHMTRIVRSFRWSRCSWSSRTSREKQSSLRSTSASFWRNSLKLFLRNS